MHFHIAYYHLKKKKRKGTFQQELKRQLSLCGLQITFGPATCPAKLHLSLRLTGMAAEEIDCPGLFGVVYYSEVRTKVLMFKFYFSH